MQIQATPRAEQLIADLMSTGRHKSPADLVETALAALASRESFNKVREELEQASERMLTAEVDQVEEEAVEHLTRTLGGLDGSAR